MFSTRLLPRIARPMLTSRRFKMDLAKPLEVPEKLLLGPGPTNIRPEVLRALSLPTLGHLHKETLQIMQDVKQGLQYMFRTQNRVTLCVSGTGHSGMEASLSNLIEVGDVALIGHNGIWGERAADMARRQGADVRLLSTPPGGWFTFEQIEKSISEHKPKLLFVCHGESSSGVLQPIKNLGQLCHKHDCLLIVDTVASLGGTEVRVDDWEIDVIYSGSQKVLGCPPGLAPMSYSDRAIQAVQRRSKPPTSFCYDVTLVGNYFHCFDEAPRYHHTGPVSLYYALRESLRMFMNEGLDASVARHQRNAELLHEGLQTRLGLQLFVDEKDKRLPCVTTIKVPDGVDAAAVIGHLMQEYKIEIAGGLGATAGKIWRIGLMGYNSNEKSVEIVLDALEKALKKFRK